MSNVKPVTPTKNAYPTAALEGRLDPLARALTEARLACRQLQVDDLAATVIDAESAYRVQNAVTDQLGSHGYGRARGYKVGLVSANMRAWLGGPPVLGVDEPVYGPLMSSTMFEGDAQVPFDNFIRPYVEGEFGVRIAEDVPTKPQPYTAESILDFVGECFAGIELVDWRVDYTSCGPPLAPIMIADGACNWGSVVGPGRHDWHCHDILGLTATMSVDGKPVHTGCASDLDDNPMRILAWLANKLAARGNGLRAGDAVLLGAVTPSYKEFGRGAEIVVDWELFGRVGVRFV